MLEKESIEDCSFCCQSLAGKSELFINEAGWALRFRLTPISFA